MAAGAVSLKLPNFLTTSQDITKGADQANHQNLRKAADWSNIVIRKICNLGSFHKACNDPSSTVFVRMSVILTKYFKVF